MNPEVVDMLRLTVVPAGASRSTLIAEGRLVGEWADLLETECRRVMKSAGPVELNLTSVVDMDTRGLTVLRRLRQELVELRGLSPLMLALLSEEAVQ